MHQTRSKFLQRDKGRPGGRSARAAQKANERRAPFFYQIKKLSSDAKSDFPDWLLIEIREAGGTKGWIKKMHIGRNGYVNTTTQLLLLIRRNEV